MCSKRLSVRLCFLFLCASAANGYKILGVFPFFSPSHFFLGNELCKGLAEAGHDVTMLTVFEEKNPPKNGKYRLVFMEGVRDKQKVLLGEMIKQSFNENETLFSNPFTAITRINSLRHEISENLLTDPKMQELIKSKEKYDVVIVSQFIVEITKVLAPILQAHLVLLNNNAPNSWMNHFVGNPTLPSLNSEMMLGFTGQMDFQQRLVNTLLSMAKYLSDHFIVYPQQSALVHKYVSEDIDLSKVQYNVSLVLSNSHPSITKSQSSVPCMKEIGGFHIKTPKELPQELREYLDDAEHGVIYFSMGSNLKGADLSIKIRTALIKAFSKRKENILWKFEVDEMPGKPENVMIQKWLPQSDILAHPNVKLFVTHGGFLSTIETVYHGVPTIAIPIFGDQLNNARAAEKDGYSKVIEFAELDEEMLSSAIEEVLSNKTYRENVKHVSKIFHDRQIKPMEEAVYWIEYIVKYNGAKHLRVDYLDLYWYQYFMLDVFAVIFSVMFLVIFVTKKIVCAVLGLCKSRSLALSDKFKTH